MKSSSTSSQPPPQEPAFAFKASWTQASTRKGSRWVSRSLPPSNCAPTPSTANGTTLSRLVHNATVIFLQSLSSGRPAKHDWLCLALPDAARFSPRVDLQSASILELTHRRSRDRAVAGPQRVEVFWLSREGRPPPGDRLVGGASAARTAPAAFCHRHGYAGWRCA